VYRYTTSTNPSVPQSFTRFVVVCSLAALGCSPAAASKKNPGAVAPAPSASVGINTVEQPDPGIAAMVARLDLDKYKATVKGLTQFGDRRQGTDRNRAAVTWIEAQLRSNGCTDIGRIKYDYQPPSPPSPEGRGGQGVRPHWIEFKLIGTRSNRSAIGAEVTVEFGGVPQRQVVDGGVGFCSQNDRRLHFGLGDERPGRVTIRWPSGTKQVLEGLAPDRLHEITEPPR